MKEALVKVEVSVVADEEATEVAEAGEGAFHFPAPAGWPPRQGRKKLAGGEATDGSENHRIECLSETSAPAGREKCL